MAKKKKKNTLKKHIFHGHCPLQPSTKNKDIPILKRYVFISKNDNNTDDKYKTM